MTAKQYLSQLRKIESRIEINIEQLERLRSLAEKTTTVFSPCKSYGSNQHPDKIAEIVCKIIELEDLIAIDLGDLLKTKIKIWEAINKVGDANFRMILLLRYVECRNWKDIAEEMFYSERWIYQAHGQALQEIKVEG